MKWEIMSEPPPETPRFGKPEGAQVAIHVEEIEGEQQIWTECLCGACFELQEGGPPVDLEPGVHYMRHTIIVYPGGPWGATEYDGEWSYPDE